MRNGFGAVTSLTESWASDGSVTTAAGAPIASRTTSYTYDPYVRYHLTETNPLGQTQTNTYDPLHGLPLTTTGPNGLTTQWTYNAWGQATQELRADGTKTKSYRYNCTTIVCPANAAYALVTVADGAPVSAVYKDILHRTVRKSVQGFERPACQRGRRLRQPGPRAAAIRARHRGRHPILDHRPIRSPRPTAGLGQARQYDRGHEL